MGAPRKSDSPSIVYCACGCGEQVPIARYPSQQRRYINGHQHRGTHNGNFRGGKERRCCPVCGTIFYEWPSQLRRTCGNRDCYIEWQRLTTAARGVNHVAVTCANCGRELHLFPSQVKQRNYCNRLCLAKDNPKNGSSNGNWRGGRWRFLKEQTMQRDGYRCVICGFDHVVDVHHITARADGGTNDFSNLITLCPNHHRMANLGIISVEHLRNTEWTPADDIDTSIPPAANH